MPDNPQILYRSKPQTDAAAVSDIRKFFPVPRLSASCYGIKQDFEQLSTSFVALALNTPHPNDATAFLQLEEQTSDKGALIAKWTRNYYQIPPSWDEFENVSYTFPGYPGYLSLPTGISSPVGRNPQTPVNGVTCRIHRDYFMVGAGQTYANEGAIPEIAVQTFVGAANPTFRWDPPTVVPAAGLAVGNLNFLATTPSRETWDSWVTNAATNGWSSDTSGVNQGQIVISCKLEQLMGNIWARVTRYVLAQ